jgi:hypothetical protein
MHIKYLDENRCKFLVGNPGIQRLSSNLDYIYIGPWVTGPLEAEIYDK